MVGSEHGFVLILRGYLIAGVGVGVFMCVSVISIYMIRVVFCVCMCVHVGLYVHPLTCVCARGVCFRVHVFVCGVCASLHVHMFG